MFLKEPIYRNERYLRYVASMPCVRCSVHGYSQAAHEEFGKGMALKQDDRRVFPLCCTRPGVNGCHYEHTMLIGMSREDRRRDESEYVTRTQTRARLDGWRIFGHEVASV